MSATSFAQSKDHLHAIAGGHPNKRPKEVTCTRPDALFYRSQTLAIVRHFFEISCQIGRLPSILGRVLFRAKVSHHRVPSFEEQVVFVHDVECALARLNPQNREVVSLVGLYQYSLAEVATLLRQHRSTVIKRFTEGIDTLAQMFLASGMLREDNPDRRIRRFNAKKTAPQVEEPLPKKPCESIAAELPKMVTEVNAKYSFVEQQRVV
ncbi:MAG TPA: hypothetical protein VII29_17720 [Terriglobales bacterium]|jgi:hypothetical protein